MPSLSYLRLVRFHRFEKAKGIDHRLKNLVGCKLDFRTPVKYKVCQTDKPI